MTVYLHRRAVHFFGRSGIHNESICHGVIQKQPTFAPSERGPGETMSPNTGVSDKRGLLTSSSRQTFPSITTKTRGSDSTPPFKPRIDNDPISNVGDRLPENPSRRSTRSRALYRRPGTVSNHLYFILNFRFYTSTPTAFTRTAAI